jgi:hypothetical protein
VVALRARGAKVQENDVAPLAKVPQAIDLKIGRSARDEAIAQCPRDCLGQT